MLPNNYIYLKGKVCEVTSWLNLFNAFLIRYLPSKYCLANLGSVFRYSPINHLELKPVRHNHFLRLIPMVGISKGFGYFCATLDGTHSMTIAQGSCILG